MYHHRDYDGQSHQSEPKYTIKRYVMPSRREGSEYQPARRRSVVDDYEYALETDYDREFIPIIYDTYSPFSTFASSFHFPSFLFPTQ